MKTRILFLLLGLFISQTIFGQRRDDSKALPRPKLVVGLMVDQMRWDYLYKYYERYGNEGFKRMLNEGFTCENTYIDYVPTVTGIGHSTVYTGTVPAIHGIAGNDFIINKTGETMYCAEDKSVETIGSHTDAGKMSPRNLLSTTIGDELKLATNFRSKVIGIALKDRGSILPAGHSANAAYWYDGATGNWISSSYYMKDLPKWVKSFNDQKLAEKYLKQDWNTLYDIKSYIQSSVDDNEYEGLFEGETKPIFPKKTSQMISNGYGVLSSTPYGNTFTLDMAKAAIDNEKMGQGKDTDLLAISLSATDYVGHKFGINAIEIEDTYLRLDRDIADFLKYLDQNVGKGNYTIFLTSDHGGAHNVAFLNDNKIPSSKWSGSRVLRGLNERLEEVFNVKEIAMAIKNYQVYFNTKTIDANKLDQERVLRISVDFLKKQDDIAFVVDLNKVGDAAVPEELKSRIVNGHNYARSGGIQLILDPARLSTGSTGTSHSAWNPYDSKIPLIWMGWGIKQGSTVRQVHMTDIAPTVSNLLRIQPPNGNIGKSIEEVFETLPLTFK
jgi:predicted AlkP superfamily pyrophosphatase or phosphodiesterase